MGIIRPVITLYEPPLCAPQSRVYTQTDSKHHLFLIWTFTKPTEHPRYRYVRGAVIPCGVTYTWFDTRCVEQGESGKTNHHSFLLGPLFGGTVVYYFITKSCEPKVGQWQTPKIKGIITSPVPGSAGCYGHKTNKQIFPAASYTTATINEQDCDIDDMLRLVPATLIRFPTPHWYRLTAGLVVQNYLGPACNVVLRWATVPGLVHIADFGPFPLGPGETKTWIIDNIRFWGAGEQVTWQAITVGNTSSRFMPECWVQARSWHT